MPNDQIPMPNEIQNSKSQIPNPDSIEDSRQSRSKFKIQNLNDQNGFIIWRL